MQIYRENNIRLSYRLIILHFYTVFFTKSYIRSIIYGSFSEMVHAAKKWAETALCCIAMPKKGRRTGTRFQPAEEFRCERSAFLTIALR